MRNSTFVLNSEVSVSSVWCMISDDDDDWNVV